MYQAFSYQGSVAQLPLKLQTAEIDRRLAPVLEDCLKRQAAMTPSHIRVALGIDGKTLDSWLEGASRGRTAKAEGLRAALLRSWLQRAELATLEAISGNSKNSGAVFLARAVYHYSDKEQTGRDEAAAEPLTLEDLL